MTDFISRGLSFSSPLYTTCHFSSAVMSALLSAKWPPADLKKNHTPYNFFFSKRLSSLSVQSIHSPTAPPNHSDFSWVMTTRPGHTKLPALLWDGTDGSLKLNMLHVARKYHFLSLIYESSDRFCESDLHHWSPPYDKGWSWLSRRIRFELWETRVSPPLSISTLSTFIKRYIKSRHH